MCFNEIRTTEIAEQNGTLHEYVHEKSGAKLLWLETADDNKLFSVTFQTVPEDSTGVFHILEHSVLCGSKKYPVKDPFLQLAKESMNTYLNAMTFPEHTSYPVSSRNEKDFKNLVSVYLDAVFNPAIYDNKNIFYQEGWHYETDHLEEKAFVNGVVYNEMKGVESAVDTKLHTELMKLLYPDTCYRFVSGGSTDEIPKLTYEQFINVHKRFYRPDNAIFYLEGNLNFNAIVQLIEEYMYECESSLDIPEIALQQETSVRKTEITYPLSSDESLENRVQIMLGKTLCEYADRKKVFATMLLVDYLTSSLESPLTQMVLAEQLGQDIRMMIDNSVRQPYLFLHLVNTEAGNEDRLAEVMSSLKDAIIETNCLYEGLEPIITNLEFKSREQEEPRALIHSMNVSTSVLFGADAELYLQYRDLFHELRNLLQTDYYEKLLEEILNPEAYSIVIALPSFETEKEDLYSIPVTKEIIEENAKLNDWQMAPDNEAAVAKLPHLSLADIDELPKEHKYKELKLDDVKILLHAAPISDMAYLNLYFPVPNKYEERLSDVSLLGNMLLNLPTENYDPMSLYQKMKSVMGDLSFEFINSFEIGKKDESITYLAVHASYLKESAKEAITFISEVLYRTCFDEEDFATNILLQLLEAFRNETIESGHTLGMLKALSSWSSVNGATELLEGLACLDNLKQILESETGVAELLSFLKELSKELFTKEQLVIGITLPEADASEPELVQYGITSLLESIPSGKAKECIMSIQLEHVEEEISIPATISYATAGIHRNPSDASKAGAWQVASKILSLEYLWSEIRMRGGAYGSGMTAGVSGNIAFYSYRDPNGEESLSIFKKCSAFLREFVHSGTELDGYIIGTISNTEPLLSPKDESILAERDYLSGINYDILCEVRKGILETTPNDLLMVADELEKLEQEYVTCLIKGESA